MGLYNLNFPFPFPFPCRVEGVLLVFVMYALVLVALLKKTVDSIQTILEVVGCATAISYSEEDLCKERFEGLRARRVSITSYGALLENRCKDIAARRSNGIVNGGGNMWTVVECCVCLCRFDANEEVSELSCKHFFHKDCLQKWFDNRHSSCPLCRSIM